MHKLDLTENNLYNYTPNCFILHLTNLVLSYQVKAAIKYVFHCLADVCTNIMRCEFAVDSSLGESRT